MVEICPRCQQRYSADRMSGDFVHECDSGNATLDQESIVILGSWEDYTGSADVASSHVQVAGTQNDLWGTRGGIEGATTSTRDVRGKKKALYRSRQHLQYIPSNGGDF